MKILAIDTSMAACSAAVYDGSVLASQWQAMDRGHAEAIAPMVKTVMTAAGLRFAEIGRIAVTIGPGTFTGVRIGLAMARGLGLALDIPVIGIDTLSAIAANGGATQLPLLVAADARRGEVYAALFCGGRMLRPPAVLPIAQLDIPDGALIAGTAADAVIVGRSDLARAHGGDLPDAAKFARLAVLAPAPGGMPAPLYLRSPDAKPQPAPVRQAIAPGIREAAAAEAPLFAALHAECFDNPWTDHDFAELMAMPGTTALIAAEAGEPVGFLLLRRAADEAEILTIGTRPFARRRGVAKALIDHAAGSPGTDRLFIEVAASNGPAKALYAACGFSEAGTRRNYYARPGGAREDALLLRKELTP